MSQSTQNADKPNDAISMEDLIKIATEFREKVYLNKNNKLKDPSGDYINGLIERLSKKYDKAISFFSKAIKLDPDNPGLYSSRGETYWRMKEYEKSIQDYNRALEYENLDVNKYFKGPFDDISRMILPAVKGPYMRVCVPFEEELESFLEISCKKIIQLFPQVPAGYLHLGIYYLAKNNYSEAIDHFTQYITLSADKHFGVFLRGICRSKIRQKGAANEDFLKAVESKTDWISGQISEEPIEFNNTGDNRITESLSLIKNQFANYTLLNNTSDYSPFLGFIGKTYSTHTMLNALDIFFELYERKHFDVNNISSLVRNLDNLRFSEIESSKDLAQLTAEIFSHYPNFTSLKDVFKRDTEPVFRINVKLSLLKYLASGFVPEDIDWSCDDSIEDKENGLLGLIHQRTLNQQYNFTHTFMHLTEELQRESTEIIKRKEHEKAQALVDERNKIIADLSHSIKNLISTVIDPLENLKQEKVIKPVVIQNALRGANLIREIVNAMNLSFKGSIEDFYYDARNNTGKGRMDLESILYESLVYSIGNMFDGKYFSNFVQKYFPQKNTFSEAKSQWVQISQSWNVQKLMEYSNKYFFNTDLEIPDGSKFVMGNEKGSALKLLILFQELILNAVKYSAFVNKERRFVYIQSSHTSREISIKIQNRYKEKVKIKTTGIGHVIVENFAKLLNTQPVIKKDGDVYSVEIKFENFFCG